MEESEAIQGRKKKSVHPLSNEDVRVSVAAVEAVGGEYEVLAVVAEHREGVESIVKGQLLQTGTVDVDEVKVELAAALVLVVGGEDDLLAGRMPVGRPVCLANVRDLLLVAAVGIGDEDLQVAGLHEALFQQVLVGFRLLALWTGSTPDDLAAIGREKGAAVVSELVGQLLQVGAVDIHGPEFEVAAAGGGEKDAGTVGRKRRFGIVTGVVGELGGDVAFEVGGEDVVGVVNGPDVEAIDVAGRLFGAGIAAKVGGSVDDGLVAAHEVGAGGAALAGGQHLGRRVAHTGNRHHEDLVTAHAPIGKI